MNTIIDWKYFRNLLPNKSDSLGGCDDLEKIVRVKSERGICDEVVANEYRIESLKLIEEASKIRKGDWRILKNKYLKGMKSSYYKCRYLRLFGVIAIGYKGEFICEMIGLADVQKKIHLVLGCDYAHPFIICNQFYYANSDGSGPDLIIDKDKFTSRLLVDLLKAHFTEFCDDHPH